MLTIFTYKTVMFAKLVRGLARMIAPAPPTKLGRWNTLDNIDIKSALANIDSCGDRLCGDVKTAKAAIDKYQKSHQKSTSQ